MKAISYSWSHLTIKASKCKANAIRANVQAKHQPMPERVCEADTGQYQKANQITTG